MDSCLSFCFLNVPFKFPVPYNNDCLLYRVAALKSTKGLASLPLCLCLGIALLVFCEHVGPPVLFHHPFLSHLRKSYCWVGCGPLSVFVSQETLQRVKRIFSYMMTWQSVRLWHGVTVDYHSQARPKCVSLGVCSLNIRANS